MATKYEKITNIRNEDRHNFPFSYFRTISYFVAVNYGKNIRQGAGPEKTKIQHPPCAPLFSLREKAELHERF